MSNPLSVSLPDDPHPLLARARDDLHAAAPAGIADVRLLVESVGDHPEAWQIDVDGQSVAIRAARPRAAYRATWDLLDRAAVGEPPAAGLVRPPLHGLVSIWDQLGVGYNRDSVGFDWDAHLAEAVRLGITHLECNSLATPYTLQDDDPEDPYIQWNLFGPALDQFAASDLTEGLYPPAYLQANMAHLRKAVARFRDWDIDPIMLVYEPRWLPEQFFHDNPHLRGPRTDHPGRGTTPRYALDVDHPAVLEHYRQLVARIVAAVPDLAGICVIGEDSGAGYNFTANRYAGPNGTFRGRMHTLGQRVGDFFRALGSGLDADDRPRGLWHICDSFGWEHELPEVLDETDPRVGIMHVTPQEDFFELDGERLATPWHGANQVRIDDVVRLHSRQIRDTGHPDLPMATIHGWMTEPVVGVPMPWVMADKFRNFAEAGYDTLALYGGHIPPTHTPFNVNQHVARAVLRDPGCDADQLVTALARRWAPDDSDALLDAWRQIDAAMRRWPFRPTGDHMGCMMVWCRHLYRPLVVRPDLLNEQEQRRIYRHSMNVWFDAARFHYLWEGTRKRFEPDVAVGAADRVEKHLLGPLAEAIERLGGIGTDAAADHRDRVDAVRLLAAHRVRALRVGALLDPYYEGTPPDAARRTADEAAFRGLAEQDIADARHLADLIARTGGRVVLQGELETPFILGTDVGDRLAERAALTRRELDSPATTRFFAEPFVADPWPYRGRPGVPPIFAARL